MCHPRKSAKSQFIFLFMALWMILCAALAGCGPADSSSAGPPGTILSETDTTLRIVDMAGRTVEVPKEMESCAFVYRVLARFLVSLDVGDRIVGAGKPEEFLVRIQPSLAETPSVGQGVVDLEALAQADPDVFFHKAGDTKTLDSVEKLGIPAVGLRFETPEDMLTALDILGKVCGQQEKADALISYYRDKTARQAERVRNIPEESRKTAIMMGTTLGKVADGTMLQSTMIQAAGGINPAAEVDATELWPTVGVEEIFAWNPDYIFITNSQDATYTVEDLMNDPAWSALEAVRSGHVYVMPCPGDSWEFPGIVSLLGIDYMTMVMYPDRMDRAGLEAEAEAFYTLSYGIPLTLEDLGFEQN